MQLWPAQVITSDGRYYRQVMLNWHGDDVWIANRSGYPLAKIEGVPLVTHRPDSAHQRRYVVTDDEVTWLAWEDIGGCGCGGSSDVAATAEQLALLEVAAAG